MDRILESIYGNIKKPILISQWSFSQNKKLGKFKKLFWLSSFNSELLKLGFHYGLTWVNLS